MDLMENQLTMDQIFHGSLRSTNQSNLRMKWFTCLEKTFLAKSLLVSQFGKKHPMTKNIEYSKGMCLTNVFSVGSCVKFTQVSETGQ